MADSRHELTILNDSFVEQAYLAAWTRLSYRLALNGPTRCTFDLALDDPKAAACTAGRWVRAMRDGADIWLGRIQIEAWLADDTSPSSNVYPVDAWDMGAQLGTRTLNRLPGEDYNKRTGPADDVAKAYVYYEAGAGASAGRPLTGLYVQANASAVGSVTKLWLGGTLLEHLQRLAKEKAFWWGFAPHYSAGVLNGVEFRTAYPLWGVDRTLGAAGEIVLEQDNHNVSSMAYKLDLTQHINFVYVAGPGEDRNQLVLEAYDPTALAAYGRREGWLTSDNLTVAGLAADAGAYLQSHAAVETITAIALPGVIGPANLGDKLTVRDRRFGRTVQKDAIITAMTIAVDERGVETVTPEMTVV